jgi:hypothetical protein
LLLAWFHAASAQTFSSGSTGADGAFAPPAGTITNITVRPGGVYHYTTVNIPSTADVRYFRGSDNAPVVILATGNVTIDGDIIVGGNGGSAPATSGVPIIGGTGGPGGFNGGVSSGTGFVATAGEGPAGGQPTAGNGGAGGTYGAPQSFVGLTPLFGGSGGGGSNASGGGGGGAILIASSTRITINGSIEANGGNSGATSTACANRSGAGAGGAIRLVAPVIAGDSTSFLEALSGATASNCGVTVGGVGGIRFEASSLSGFMGQTNPVASIANAPGPVSAAGNPSLVNVPTLMIASIGGLAVPAVPAGSYSAPDLALAPGTANPIPVVVNATNTPVGSPTQITVRVTPRSPGTVTNVNVPPGDHAGTFESSSATANVTLPEGQVSLLQALATMTLTGQFASLLPLIDGEPVERVTLATTPGQASTLSLITESGKAVPMDALPPEDRMRVARAWEIVKATRQ